MSESNNTVSGFPVGKVDAARAAVAKSYARLVKAAGRAGATVPAEPVLVVKNERGVVRCGHCGSSGETADVGNDCAVCSTGVYRPYRVCDVEVTCDRPRLAGWDFLAVVEPLNGSNLVKRVPGSDASVDLAAYRDHDGSCDHCKTVRRRNETFVVRSTGEDIAVAAGAVKVVGRNCLAAFLGGESPATVLWRLTLTRIVGECAGDGEGGGGRGTLVFGSKLLLSWVASVIRHDGWVSKAAARAYNEAGGNKESTASKALYCLETPWHRDEVKAWKKECERLAPNADDIAKAEAALTWARGLAGTSDYEASLSLVAKGDTVLPKHAGILASAVSSYERFLGKEVERKNRAELNAKSDYVGAVGEKVVVTVTCEGCFSVDTDYGALHINRFRDEAGNVLVWKTGSVKYDAGKALTLKGTVKEHSEYKGTKNTILTRCSEVDPNAPVKVKKARKSKVEGKAV